LINFGTIENWTLWCIFPLILIGVIAFASNMHDEFMSERKRKQSTVTKLPIVVPKAPSQKRLDRGLTHSNVVRGYDSPELFREDLWLLRIDQSRKAHALENGSMQVMRAGIYETSARSICAILAQHPGARCDN
jgi:hypothetical protein